MRLIGGILYVICNVLILWMAKTHFLTLIPEVVYGLVLVMNLGMLMLLREGKSEQA